MSLQIQPEQMPFHFERNIQRLNLKTIEIIIECKRTKLHELVQRKGSLLDSDVIQASQEIDQYLVQLKKGKIKHPVTVIIAQRFEMNSEF